MENINREFDKLTQMIQSLNDKIDTFIKSEKEIKKCNYKDCCNLSLDERGFCKQHIGQSYYCK